MKHKYSPPLFKPVKKINKNWNRISKKCNMNLCFQNNNLMIKKKKQLNYKSNLSNKKNFYNNKNNISKANKKWNFKARKHC